MGTYGQQARTFTLHQFGVLVVPELYALVAIKVNAQFRIIIAESL